jgi:hypothetical protein
MTDIYLDKSRNIRLRARIGEAAVPRVFKFRTRDENEATAPLDITDLDFELIVFKRTNSSVRIFTLTIGDGLTVQGDDNDELLVEISQERSEQRRDTFFWRLRSDSEDHTWLNGPFEFHDGENDAVLNEDIVKIYQNG